MEGYFFNLGASIDQTGGAFAGFGRDWTISATTGRNSRKLKTFHWKLTEFIIDLTFYPVDGTGHCLYSWRSDSEETYRKGSWLVLFITALVGCLILGVIFWTIFIIKNVWKLFIKLIRTGEENRNLKE